MFCWRMDSKQVYHLKLKLLNSHVLPQAIPIGRTRDDLVVRLYPYDLARQAPRAHPSSSSVASSRAAPQPDNAELPCCPEPYVALRSISITYLLTIIFRLGQTDLPEPSWQSCSLPDPLQAMLLTPPMRVTARSSWPCVGVARD